LEERLAGKSESAVPAPEGEVTIVFSDITRAASLWERHPAAMRDATLLHNDTLRSLLSRHNGYESIFSRYFFLLFLNGNYLHYSNITK
jgi:class 3 adenylate cyclase